MSDAHPPTPPGGPDQPGRPATPGLPPQRDHSQPSALQPHQQPGPDPRYGAPDPRTYQQPGYQQPGYQQPGYQQPGYQQPGMYHDPQGPYGDYPQQWSKPKKPWWRRRILLLPVWLWVAFAGIVMTIAAAGASSTSDETGQAPSSPAASEPNTVPVASDAAPTTTEFVVEPDELPEPTVAITDAATDSAEQAMTPGQANAVRSAENYLSFAGFSRQGLIDQLSSEYGDQFSVEDATFAVDHVNPDWNQQAARSAKSYLDFQGFSCQGLIDQLSSEFGEQFTVEQATYGANEAGAC